MIGLDSRPMHAAGVLAQRSADTIVLLSTESGLYYTLNEVGARAWDLCDGTRDVAELVRMLEAEYDAPLDAIQTDVLEILEDLERERLVSLE